MTSAPALTQGVTARRNRRAKLLTSLSTWKWTLLVVLLGLGVFTRFAGIRSASTNWDELIIHTEGRSNTIRNQPSAAIISTSAGDFAVRCARAGAITYAPGQFFFMYWLMDRNDVLSERSLVGGRIPSAVFATQLIFLFAYVGYRLEGRQIGLATLTGLTCLVGSQLHWVSANVAYSYEAGALATFGIVLFMAVAPRLTSGLFMLGVVIAGCLGYFNYQTVPLIALCLGLFVLGNPYRGMAKAFWQQMVFTSFKRKWADVQQNLDGTLLARIVHQGLYRLLLVLPAVIPLTAVYLGFVKPKIDINAGIPEWVNWWTVDSPHITIGRQVWETWSTLFRVNSALDAAVTGGIAAVVVFTAVILGVFRQVRLSDMERRLAIYASVPWLLHALLFAMKLSTMSPSRHSLYLLAPTMLLLVIALRVVGQWLTSLIPLVRSARVAYVCVLFAASLGVLLSYNAYSRDAADTCTPQLVNWLAKKYQTKNLVAAPWYYLKARCRLHDLLADSTLVLVSSEDEPAIRRMDSFVYISQDDAPPGEVIPHLNLMKTDMYTPRRFDLEPHDSLGSFPNTFKAWYLRPTNASGFQQFLAEDTATAQTLQQLDANKPVDAWFALFQAGGWRPETWGIYPGELWTQTLPRWYQWKARHRVF